VYAVFWWNRLRESSHFEDPGVDDDDDDDDDDCKWVRDFYRSRHRWEDNIKMDLQEVDRMALTGLIWLRIWTSGD
jgi:hypothetical protein